MKERFIYAPSLRQDELLKSMATISKSSFGVRIFNSYSLLEYFLSLKGFINNELIIDNVEKDCIIYSIISNNKNFPNPSYEEARKYRETIDTVRRAGFDFNKLSNKLVSDVNEEYKRIKHLNNEKDSLDYIELGIYKLDEHYDVDIIVLDEVELDNLDKKILSHFNLIKMSYKDAFDLKENKVNIKQIASCYTDSNEIEYIVKTINEKNIPFNEVNIVLADPSKRGYVFNCLTKYELEYCSSFGRSIYDSNAFNLFKTILYNDENFNSVEQLDNLLKSSFFDTSKFIMDLNLNNFDMTDRRQYQSLCETLGRFRFLRDEQSCWNRVDTCIKTNKEALEYFKNNNKPEMGENFSKFLEYENAIYAYLNFVNLDYAELLEKYCICDDKYQEYCLGATIDFINIYKKYFKNINLDILRVFPNTLYSGEKNNGIYVTSISNLSTFRKYTFVVGLDNSYPGRSDENYLLYDEDILLFDKNSELISTHNTERKIKQFNNYLSIASLFKCEIYLSYSNFDAALHKDKKSSSLLFSVYKKYKNGKNFETFSSYLTQVSFSDRLSNDSILITEHNNNENIEMKSQKDKLGSVIKDKYIYSPSAIGDYLSCPRKFYYKRVLNLEEPLEYKLKDNMTAADYGTLTHLILECLYSFDFKNKEEFNEITQLLIDAFINRHLYLNIKQLNDDRDSLLNIASNQYDLKEENILMYSDFNVISEEEVFCKHPSGIILKGYPDSVRIQNGRTIIVDYKTKRRVEHKKDDINTCFQVVAYAYIMQHAPAFKNQYNIDHCEYHYLRYGKKTINCKYDKDMENKLNEILVKFKNSLDTGDFPRTPTLDFEKYEMKKETCDRLYCKFYSLCSKAKGNEDEQD